jgi:allantoin racemase
MDIDADPQGAIRAIVDEARIAVELDKAEVICLGCAGMAGLEEAITSALGVPVIDGVGAAVRLAEAVVGLSLRTSKLSTYAFPDPKKIIGWPLSQALGLSGTSTSVGAGDQALSERPIHGPVSE